MINAIRDLYLEGSRDLVKRLSKLFPSVCFCFITPNSQREFRSQAQSNVKNGGQSALPSCCPAHFLAHEHIKMYKYLWEFLTNSEVCQMYGVKAFVSCN